MSAFWHPLSTILIAAPRCYATDGLVRMLAAANPRLTLIYAGDRMWPALAHGATFGLEAAGDDPPTRGSVVLVSRAGIPDVLRVERVDGGRVALTADADPELHVVVPGEEVLGRVALPGASCGRRRRALRRLSLDLREAWRGRPDHDDDPAETVRDKYESQAAFYARAEGPEIEPRLIERVRKRVAAGRRLLVVGSGAGRESFALAAAGWDVTGVEFSESMVELASREAERRGLAATFVHADIRGHEVPEASFACILFTYDVYSFIPGSEQRTRLLRRMRGWLEPGGLLLLSARRLRRAYDRWILGLQWLAVQRSGAGEWGDSHTRWIPSDGSLRRSYVHVFSPTEIAAESAAAGFRVEPWEGGHAVLVPDPTAIIRP